MINVVIVGQKWCITNHTNMNAVMTKPKSKGTRKSIEFRGLVDAINGHKDTPEWKALSFGAKVRLILIEALGVEA